MKRFRRCDLLRLSLLFAWLAGIAACGGDTATELPPARPDDPTAFVPARVAIEPAAVAVVAGDTVRVRATVYNDRAQPISAAVVTWASGDSAIATVDATGLVTGVKGGNASLTARSGRATTTAPVTVQSQDRQSLLDLYDAASGDDWTNNRNWGADEPIGSWHGVTVNAEFRVTALDLSENGLKGRLPEHLGNLAFLTELRVDGNEALTGPIPFSLSGLGIQTLHYGGTMLCTLRDERFRAWLNAIPTRDGELTACNEERSDLMKLYEATGGENWRSSTNWGTEAPLEDWLGIALDPTTGRVVGLNLSRNNLTGEIPPEIQYFEYLEFLRLDYNELEGEIPPYIGKLTELVRLDLDGNHFTGEIPPEIGNLRELRTLWLGGNRMTGRIPPELGNLRRLEALHLYEAPFEGSIPEEFGNLRQLRELQITDVDISGPLPESLGRLGNLSELYIYRTGVTGPLPAALGIQSREVPDHLCGAQTHAEAYLTQAVQSREYPVPLVAGESALLRVFVMSEQETAATIPPVRATFFLDGGEVHVENIPAGSSPVPMELREGELDLTANALIPAEVIRPGLEMVVEVDPDGTLDPDLGVSKRIPESGRAAVDVREVPPFYFTLIPFVSTTDDDRAAADFVSTADPDDEMFWQTRNLLPVADFEVTRHEPVTVDTNVIDDLLRDVGRIRQMEEGIGYWMGLIPNPAGGSGIAYLPFQSSNRAYRGKTSVAVLDAERTTTKTEAADRSSVGHSGHRFRIRKGEGPAMSRGPLLFCLALFL